MPERAPVRADELYATLQAWPLDDDAAGVDADFDEGVASWDADDE